MKNKSDKIENELEYTTNHLGNNVIIWIYGLQIGYQREISSLIFFSKQTELIKLH